VGELCGGRPEEEGEKRKAEKGHTNRLNGKGRYSKCREQHQSQIPRNDKKDAKLILDPRREKSEMQNP